MNLLQRAPVDKFRFWCGRRITFHQRREVTVDEFPRLDQAVEFGLEPVFGEGVSREDGFQRDRPGVAQETLEDGRRASFRREPRFVGLCVAACDSSAGANAAA